MEARSNSKILGILISWVGMLATVIAAQYSNPVEVTNPKGEIAKVSVADPSVILGDDGLLYCFSTGGLITTSSDGCHWKIHARRVIPIPKWGDDYYKRPIHAGLWAPDVRKIQDKWILYYSLSAWGKPCGIGYAVADKIGGPYTDKGKLFTCSEIGIGNCIDPQVIQDDDGRVYMVMGSFQGIYLIELTKDGQSCLNGVEYQKENKTLIAGYPGNWDGATYEGSYIVKKDGFYYYFGSVGTCCVGKNSTYQVRVAKAEEIHGPYCGSDGIPITESGHGHTYGNLVVKAESSPNKTVAGPGHNSIFIDSNGEWWLYYHAYSNVDNFRTRRLFMDKLQWDENRFPLVEGQKPSFQILHAGPMVIEKNKTLSNPSTP